MNPGGTQFVFLLVSTLCAGGAASALTLFTLRTYNAYKVRGYDIDRGLIYDAEADQSRLPFMFRGYKWGVVFLPLVRRLQERDSLQIRRRLRNYERKLVKAGLRPYMTTEHFLSLVILSSVAWGLLLSALTFMLGFGPVAVTLSLLLWGGTGLLLPPYMLSQLTAERASLIEKRLPYATEFILLAMEASASLPMAITIYCKEMENDPLADELKIVLSDIEKGISTQEALSVLGERLQIDLLSSFILAVNTGLAMGQPIQDIMRVQAMVTRRKRYESAEEIAKKASTKATFPLILIVISVVVLLIGPLMLNFSDSFF